MKIITCILCPKGCQLSANRVNEQWQTTGNRCNKGSVFLEEELKEAKRILTTTVTIQMPDGSNSRIAVRSAEAIPKELLMEAMKITKDIKVNTPIQVGSVIYSDILGTGVDLVATQRK